MRARTQKGFTLVELLVAMAIIAVLIGLGVGAISIAQRVSRDNQRRAAVSEVNAAIQAYYGSNGSYPSSVTVTDANTLTIGSETVTVEGPASVAASSTSNTTASETVYCYNNGSDGYTLGAELEQGGFYTDLSTAGSTADCSTAANQVKQS